MTQDPFPQVRGIQPENEKLDVNPSILRVNSFLSLSEVISDQLCKQRGKNRCMQAEREKNTSAYYSHQTVWFREFLLNSAFLPPTLLLFMILLGSMTCSKYDAQRLQRIKGQGSHRCFIWASFIFSSICTQRDPINRNIFFIIINRVRGNYFHVTR